MSVLETICTEEIYKAKCYCLKHGALSSLTFKCLLKIVENKSFILTNILDPTNI